MLTLLFACTSAPDADSGLLEDSGDTGDPCVPVTWFADADGDGFGTASQALEACEQPSGYVADSTDCDDTSASIHPDADELCATPDVDDDCDGELNEPDAPDARTWYPDADGDGFGGPDGEASCGPIPGSIEDGTDCDDGDATVFPGAEERCDGRQNDCDADWSSDAGRAHWVGADGVWTDVASALGAGGDALAASTWTDDGTLYVCEGTWTVELTLDANVSVVGVGDVTLTGGSPTVRVQQDELMVELQSLTLQDGLTCDGDSEVTLDGVALGSNGLDTEGGGMDFDGCDGTWINGSVVADHASTPVAVRNATFTLFGGEFSDFTADEGIVAAYDDSELVIEDVWFHDFTVVEWLFKTDEEADGCPTFTMTGSTFEDAQTGDRGVLFLQEGTCLARIEDTEFTRLTGDSSVLVVNGGDLELSGVTVRENVFSDDGAINSDEPGYTLVEDSTFEDNEATGGGAPLYIDEGDATITNTVFTGNVGGWYGGALGMYGDGVVDGCTFEDNTGTNGGAISVYESLIVTDSAFTGNTSTEGTGGAIWLGDRADGLEVSGSDFSDNDPQDVFHSSDESSWTLGEDASIVCDGSGCGVD